MIHLGLAMLGGRDLYSTRTYARTHVCVLCVCVCVCVCVRESESERERAHAHCMSAYNGEQIIFVHAQGSVMICECLSGNTHSFCMRLLSQPGEGTCHHLSAEEVLIRRGEGETRVDGR